MFGSTRINSRELADLCRRLSIGLEAGVDARRVFTQEAERTRGFGARSRMRVVRDAVNAGESVYAATSEADDFFPPMFREMVKVGEETGQLGEIFGRLADHYEGRIRLLRNFLVALTLPIIELGLALFIIGLLIWIQGWLRVDALGWGLVGTRGLAVYLTILALVAAGVFMFIAAMRRGALWTGPIQRAALRLPGIGKPLRTICLARLAWSLHLTFNTGMEVRRAVRLSLQSAGNAHFAGQALPIEAAIERGEPVADAFDETRAFPVEFMNTLRVGEQSGRISESMGHLAEQYRHQAEAAMKVLATMGGFAIYILVALFLIFLIFSLFTRNILAPLQELTK